MPTKSHGLWRTWQGSTERPRLNPKIGFKGPVGQRIVFFSAIKLYGTGREIDDDDSDK